MLAIVSIKIIMVILQYPYHLITMILKMNEMQKKIMIFYILIIDRKEEKLQLKMIISLLLQLIQKKKSSYELKIKDNIEVVTNEKMKYLLSIIFKELSQ